MQFALTPIELVPKPVAGSGLLLTASASPVSPGRSTSYRTFTSDSTIATTASCGAGPDGAGVVLTLTVS